jgi:hypothetical protein
MDRRKLSDMSDDEIIAEMEGLGLTMDADNCGHGLDAFMQVLHAAATEYEPLI